jgi:hypothetical protein
MSRRVLHILGLLAALVVLAFIVVVINQTAQVVALADRLHPTAGTVTLWGLLILYAALGVTPVVLYFRLPQQVKHPASESAPEFPRYLARLKKGLASNPNVAGMRLETVDEVRSALGVLDRRADEIISDAAGTVFLSTAISQNGRLDGLLVLTAQTRLIWCLAHHYYQRPSLRDFTFLYANVAGTSFMANSFGDVDISEQVEPLMGSVIGTAASAVPGLQVVTSLIANSIMTGSANAFLRLRVGMVAKGYCGSLLAQERSVLRRSATAQAARLLGSIVITGSGRVSAAMWTAGKTAATRQMVAVGNVVADAGKAVSRKTKFWRKPGGDPEPDPGTGSV